ncbi:unnamed protein product [Spodoptera exigua]|nr:unnamed protein product [Spodoptera exigua]
MILLRHKTVSKASSVKISQNKTSKKLFFLKHFITTVNFIYVIGSEKIRISIQECVTLRGRCHRAFRKRITRQRWPEIDNILRSTIDYSVDVERVNNAVIRNRVYALRCRRLDLWALDVGNRFVIQLTAAIVRSRPSGAVLTTISIIKTTFMDLDKDIF